MTMKTLKYSLAIMGLAFVWQARAQQEPMFTQYVLNTQIINPGYVGYKEALNVTGVHRSQWVGFKGAPMTQTLSIYTPLKKRELAVGASLIHDKIGPTRQSEFQGDFAYRLRLSNRAMLSFGLKATVGLYQVSLTDLLYTSSQYDLLLQQPIPDEAFAANMRGLVLPNVGFGVFYFKRDYFVGLSSPKMIRNRLQKRSNELWDFTEGSTEPTVYLMGGYIFEINKELKFQPTALIKGTHGAPLSAGLFANLLIQKELKVGAFYHVGENFGALVQYQLNDQFRFGYSTDFAANRLIRTNFGSHEVLLNYTLNYRKKRIIYPRYF
jgi:type IX secretion system PorP/SprF family membrane protein